jgi:fructose-specific component phosphotransferase system IIB-like protein
MPRFTDYPTANTPLNSDDVVIIEQSGTTKKVNVGQLIVGGETVVAEDVTFDPTGLSNISADNVQDAFEDLDAALDALAVAGVSDGNKTDITVSGGGTVWNINNGVVDDDALANGISAAKLADGTVSSTEFQYLNGVTSAIQTQIDGKQAAATVLTNTTASFTTELETKLDGIEAGAEVNTVDSVAGKTGVVTLTSSDVGLGNVDNTSDANKPVSSATQTALDAKQATLVSGTNIKTVNGNTLLGSGDISISSAVAWGNITGTLSDQTDLVSELNDKADVSSLATVATSGDYDDLINKPTITSGTVTSVAVTVPTGLTISGSPITTSGTFGIGLDTGYVIPLQATLDGKQATITGGATTITSSNLTASRALASDGSGKVAVSSVTATELGYVSGVTSAIQTQLNAKEATVTGAATTITSSNLTASRALASDGSGKVAVSSVTATELGYVSGVTSALQTQLNAKAPLASPTFTGTVTLPAGTVVNGVTLTTAGSTSNFLRADGTYAAPTASVAWGGITGTLSSQTDLQSALDAKAATSQVASISGFIEVVDNKDYRLVVKAPFAGTITETTTISSAGTATATFKINTTALGGTANSVSSSEQSQSHASANAFSAGDDIVLTVSSNSSCTDLSFTVQFTRTLS